MGLKPHLAYHEKGDIVLQQMPARLCCSRGNAITHPGSYDRHLELRMDIIIKQKITQIWTSNWSHILSSMLSVGLIQFAYK